MTRIATLMVATSLKSAPSDRRELSRGCVRAAKRPDIDRRPASLLHLGAYYERHADRASAVAPCLFDGVSIPWESHENRDSRRFSRPHLSLPFLSRFIKAHHASHLELEKTGPNCIDHSIPLTRYHFSHPNERTPSISHALSLVPDGRLGVPYRSCRWRPHRHGGPFLFQTKRYLGRFLFH